MLHSAVLKSCVTCVDFLLPPTSRENGALDKAAPACTESDRKAWTPNKPNIVRNMLFLVAL